MTRAELLEKVLTGWFATVGEFRGWNASSMGRLDRKTGLANKLVVLTFVVECVIGGGFGIVKIMQRLLLPRAGTSLHSSRRPRKLERMSLAEIKDAVTELTPKELAELAAFIQTQDSLAWDREIEEDFSPGGKHHGLLAEIDAAIDAGEATPLP